MLFERGIAELRFSESDEPTISTKRFSEPFQSIFLHKMMQLFIILVNYCFKWAKYSAINFENSQQKLNPN